jgi:AcrR family transcriptional regulator
MPKIVDHEERRAELASAAWRLAAREGLEAITVRGVAAEAGLSTGAVVHYFRDKEELILFAFETIVQRVGRRWALAAEQATDPLELARVQVMEGLPLDAERRAEFRVWFSFLGLAFTRPAFARAQRVAYRGWRGRLAATLGDAQKQGQIDASLDCEREATALVALVDGLAVQACFEPRTMTSDRLLELVDARLDALRTGPESRTR